MNDTFEDKPQHFNDDAHFIALITGITPEDDVFWCYLAIPFDKYDAYRLAEQQGDFDLEDYGTVLAYGQGAKPPIEVKVKMREKYKLDKDFENKLAVISDLLGEDIL